MYDNGYGEEVRDDYYPGDDYSDNDVDDGLDDATADYDDDQYPNESDVEPDFIEQQENNDFAHDDYPWNGEYEQDCDLWGEM